MPHTVAFNIWSGPNAALPPAGSAGLRWFEIVVPGADHFEALLSRLAKAGASVEAIEGGDETQDPSGNRIRLIRAN